jgi:hypothetical protein
VSTCPVPSEQQPLNEYEELRQSWFFRWALLDVPMYSRKLAWVWLWSWAIAGPLSAASFAPTKHPIQFFLIGAAGASFFLFLALIRLYLGWTYIHSRLANTMVFYEESGWYDGQLWLKPPEVLARDRLIVSYQVQPILQRLRRTFGVLALLIVVGGMLWNFV